MVALQVIRVLVESEMMDLRLFSTADEKMDWKVYIDGEIGQEREIESKDRDKLGKGDRYT